MDVTVFLFLTSGLFLGWALGGNDAANVFGTAVGTRMVSFVTAAIICSIFVILGAVISGAGAAHTLGRLGAVNALPGSFMAAFSAALAVYLMTKSGLPVSTTQAIVGGIIGWNLFSGSLTDINALVTILTTWVVCPLLAAGISILLYKAVTKLLRHAKFHLLRTDAYTRAGLLLAGAFGAYSLGANNIANVMGVFVTSSPFTDVSIAGLVTISSIQQLFLLGAVAIAVGVMTYSKRVMMTVGDGLLPLSPVAAWVVVMAHSIVLFLFASQGLEHFLASNGLPTIPLVPVSSSQAVIGAVLGIGILKGGRGIRWRMLGSIGVGWILTPIIAGIACFVGLFFLQNVFSMTVYQPVPYTVSDAVLERLESDGVGIDPLRNLKGESFESATRFQAALAGRPGIDTKFQTKIMTLARQNTLYIDVDQFKAIDKGWLSPQQLDAVRRLQGRTFSHKWQLAEALAAISSAWRMSPETAANKIHNQTLEKKRELLYRTFGVGN